MKKVFAFGVDSTSTHSITPTTSYTQHVTFVCFELIQQWAKSHTTQYSHFVRKAGSESVMGSKCLLQVCARRIQIVLLYYHTFTPTGQSPLLLSCSKQTTKKYNKNIKNSSAENITVTIRGVLGVGVFAVQQKIILIIMHKKYTMIICRFHGSWYYLKIKMHEKVLF